MARLLIDISEGQLAYKFISKHQVDLKSFILNNMVGEIIKKRMFNILLILTPLQLLKALEVDKRYDHMLKMNISSEQG